MIEENEDDRPSGERVEFGDVYQRWKTLLFSLEPPMVNLWKLFVFFNAICLLLMTVMMYFGENVPGEPAPSTTVSLLNSFGRMLLSGLMAAFGFSMLLPLKKVYERPTDEAPGLEEMIGDVRKRILPALGIYFIQLISIMIGACFCLLPGLVAMYFLLPAPYIVVLGNFSMIDSIKYSFQWTKRQYPIFLALFFVILGFTGLMMVLGFVGGIFLIFTLGRMTFVVINLISGIVGVTVGFALWVFTGVVMIHVERAESLTLG